MLPWGGQAFGRGLPLGSGVLLAQAGSRSRAEGLQMGCTKSSTKGSALTQASTAGWPWHGVHRRGWSLPLKVKLSSLSRKLPPSLGPALHPLLRSSPKPTAFFLHLFKALLSVLLLHQMLSSPPCHCNNRATVWKLLYFLIFAHISVYFPKFI